MVRRRGNYQIQVLGKEVSCPFCEGTIFSHREVYVEIATYGEEHKEQLTLQSFMCKVCANLQYFQEQVKGMETNIVYIKVE